MHFGWCQIGGADVIWVRLLSDVMFDIDLKLVDSGNVSIYSETVYVGVCEGTDELLEMRSCEMVVDSDGEHFVFDILGDGGEILGLQVVLVFLDEQNKG